jgi:hypothetical protein
MYWKDVFLHPAKRKALICLTVFIVVAFAFAFAKATGLLFWTALAAGLVSVPWGIGLIFHVRQRDDIGVWSYIWRTLLVQAISAFSSAYIIVALLLVMPSGASIKIYAYYLLYLLTMMFTAWLLFSSDRVGQLKDLLKISRG